MALQGPLWAATDPHLSKPPHFYTLASNTEETESQCVNSVSQWETLHTCRVDTGMHSKLMWWKTNHRRTKFKKCPKMCILFHIIIQCLHTGILLRLLKESVKKSEASIGLKIPPLPQIPTNKIHFKTISSKLMFCPEFIESFISTWKIQSNEYSRWNADLHFCIELQEYNLKPSEAFTCLHCLHTFVLLN